MHSTKANEDQKGAAHGHKGFLLGETSIVISAAN